MPEFTNQEILAELEATNGEALFEYFDIDQTNPYSPKFTPKPGVIIKPDPGQPVQLGLGLDIANFFTHSNRQRAYRRKIKNNPALKPIVSAGDSWFSHPLLRDVINHLGDNHGYAILSLDAAGAELSEVVQSGKWATALRAENSRTLLVSGGGNDLMGDHFGDYLNTGLPAGTPPGDYLNSAFDDALNRVLKHYNTIILQVENDFPGVKVFVHSYDFAIPRPKGPWLGVAMIKAGITEKSDQRAIIKEVVTRFTKRLEQLAAANAGRVFYIGRKTNVPDGSWDDEIHPTSEGFAIVAANFAVELHVEGVTP
ncbi:SGNH/GDSL hydrolase family protein [Luteolibacter soli]|uniref:SGNH/GDSL hydrolase family protein n=1 Tax=Luteolibacter soli TaxID=3135280 RepID=A0ABU9AW32_9BACT